MAPPNPPPSSLSNREFLERLARPGRVGLSGGNTPVDRVIARAQRHLDARGHWGGWTHAFVFQGERVDGQHWVIESDLAFHRRHLLLGVQENRMAKYFDEGLYPRLAVLDFGLDAARTQQLLGEALDLVAARTRYSLAELLGTLAALRHPSLRARENLLAREQSLFCSAFVQHLFRRIGMDLSPGLGLKNTTPEDISRSPVPHETWRLRHRGAPASTTVRLARRVQRQVRRALRSARNPKSMP